MLPRRRREFFYRLSVMLFVLLALLSLLNYAKKREEVFGVDQYIRTATQGKRLATRQDTVLSIAGKIYQELLGEVPIQNLDI